MSCTHMNQLVSLVSFVRRRDYLFVKVLGQGACGQTVLLHDEMIDEHFVCKKYVPFDEAYRQELFRNFLREIKLLHEVFHRNVVRVFNYYIYPEKYAGYILMEYIEGKDVEDQIRQCPESINEIFLQTVDGFAYLESCRVLHRDIRPQNILVRTDGLVKIIDLGFGKRVTTSLDFDKSISLNWWCEPPEDFLTDTYDHSTEVYFVGKLFEKLILDNEINDFKHTTLLARMCQRKSDKRIPTFFDVKTEITLSLSVDVQFTHEEKSAYSEFARQFSSRITKIESSTKYNEDIDSIKTQLEAIYKTCMLEETLPDAAIVFRPFVVGVYFYKKTGFPTYVLRSFLVFLRASSVEKQRIALANLHSRLNAIERYETSDFDEDIPF